MNNLVALYVVCDVVCLLLSLVAAVGEVVYFLLNVFVLVG